MDPNFRSSYLEQYNLELQKQIHNSVITAGYVGSVGRHMSAALDDINTPAPGQTLTRFAAQLPKVTSIAQMTSGGVSSYNSLQVSFQQRYAHGFATDTNFTLARGLDDFVGISSGAGASGTGTIPSDIRGVDYGNSDLDMRKRFASSVIYEFPWGKSLKGIPGLLGNGWQMNALGVWGTGMPFTVLNPSYVSGTLPGQRGGDRPNQVLVNPSLGKSSRSVNEWFNTAAFAVQTAGTLGTERRNQLYGPSFRHLDLSLIKEFPLLNDKAHMQFRAESFNITNTASFSSPSATLGGSGFGTIPTVANTYTPRELQFALKVLF
jgi:hypothetical protein